MTIQSLQVEGAEVRFSPGTAAIRDVRLTLTPGRVTALLGPSGSGKSTLLRAIAGLERLHGGTIGFGGEAWSGHGVHLAPEKRRCGVVFQDYALFPHLTAEKNVAFGLRSGSRREKETAAMEGLARVELTHRAHAYPHELSGGEQQRVALARALAPRPAVMLLDEPFSGLDRRLRAELRETTIAALRAAGAAALIVTHDADEAMAVADEIALMASGTIIQTGAPDRLYLEPVSETAARLLGDVEAFDATVAAGEALTALGALPAPNYAEGAKVRVLVRPEGIIVSTGPEGLEAEVLNRRPAGGHVKLDLRLPDGRTARARAGITHAMAPGDRVRLTMDPRFARVVAF
jgi:iron(III) transport system ATP-binding protein